MLLSRIFTMGTVLGLSMLVTGISPADELSDKTTAELIKQLDCCSFSERQSASSQLAKRGSSAMSEVAGAAASPSREVSRRALKILCKWKGSYDQALSQRATSELETLAKSDNDKIARRANLMLHPPETFPVASPPAVRIMRCGLAPPNQVPIGCKMPMPIVPTQ